MGSPNGLWTSVSGAMAQSQSLDTIANNLANANTTGFKKDTPTFKEYLTALERPVSPEIDIPRTIFKDSDFYHFDGKEHAMVNYDRTHTDHASGSMRMTGQPFDMAVDGAGFFTIQGPSGLLFTRAGDFKIDGKGILTTTDGHPVMVLGAEAEAALNAAKEAAARAALPQAPGTPPVAPPAADATRNPASVNPFAQQNQNVPGKEPPLKPLNLAEAFATGQKINVTQDGAVYLGEQQIGTLAIAEFVDPKLLSKNGSSAFSNPNPANVPRLATRSRVQQGFLESSNVNPVTEILEMLKANRLFESNMKAIKSYNDMAGKEANEVGKL